MLLGKNPKNTHRNQYDVHYIIYIKVKLLWTNLMDIIQSGH